VGLCDEHPHVLVEAKVVDHSTIARAHEAGAQSLSSLAFDLGAAVVADAAHRHGEHEGHDDAAKVRLAVRTRFLVRLAHWSLLFSCEWYANIQ
jgi:hypothetical protein